MSKQASTDIARALGIPELRASMLVHTRAAFSKLPHMEQPCILDIGCGSGAATLELAQLSRGEVTGIDIDEMALAQLRHRLESAGLAARIRVLNRPIQQTGFPGGSFDLLWSEGVLHLLKIGDYLPECRRILKANGSLVIGATNEWFDTVRVTLPRFGFRCVDQHLLPAHCWWNDYYAPLEARIRAYRDALDGAPEPAELARYEHEVDMVRSAPSRFDCGFYFCC